MKNLKLKDKILSNTKITESGCMEWLGIKNERGYGMVYTGSTPANRQGMEFVHRAILKSIGIEIPKGFYSCHKCDNPSCCNPEHLFVGTPSDNMRDARNKGRKPSLKPKELKHKKVISHGTKTMYGNYKCRCSMCKKTNSEYQKIRRKKLLPFG
jgi:hypothetical protein